MKRNKRCGTVPDGDMINQCDPTKRLLGKRKNEGQMSGNQEEQCRSSGNSSTWPLLRPRVVPGVSVAQKTPRSARGIKEKRRPSDPKSALHLHSTW